MIAHRTAPPSHRDRTAGDFITTFMAHVATLSGNEVHRFGTVAGIRMLLLDALTDGNGTNDIAWGVLYRAIDALVARSIERPETHRAHAYLHAFVQENRDLA